MSNKIDDIAEDVKLLDARLDTISGTLIQQSEQLKYHISRTNTLQEMVEPIYRLRLQLIGAVKLVGVLAALGSCGWIVKVAISYLQFL